MHINLDEGPVANAAEAMDLLGLDEEGRDRGQDGQRGTPAWMIS
jgi:hypothetical protein